MCTRRTAWQPNETRLDSVFFVLILAFVSMFNRVRSLSVSATPRRTLCAVDAVVHPSTSRRRVGLKYRKTLYEDRTNITCTTACSSCGYPAAKLRSYEWGQKAKRRKTTGTGKMSYLKVRAFTSKFILAQ
jgi:hypothetical protein